MILSTNSLESLTFAISANGLFDFDLTFIGEGLLFLFLSLIVTFFFLFPISNQIENRNQWINYQKQKSTILFNFAQEKLSFCLILLTEETNEWNRQIKELRTFTNVNVENDLKIFQSENTKLLQSLKSDLLIQSVFLLSQLKKDLQTTTDQFFVKKFQSM